MQLVLLATLHADKTCSAKSKWIVLLVTFTLRTVKRGVLIRFSLVKYFPSTAKNSNSNNTLPQRAVTSYYGKYFLSARPIAYYYNIKGDRKNLALNRIDVLLMLQTMGSFNFSFLLIITNKNLPTGNFLYTIRYLVLNCDLSSPKWRCSRRSYCNRS